MVALLTAAVWAACFAAPTVWDLTGIGEGDKPFLDLRNLTVAAETAHRGLDPYAKNPLDPYNRPHGYSGWWLLLGDLGIDHTDTAWLGMVILLLTLGAGVCQVRPVSSREGILLLLVLASPPILMAVNRVNHDLLVFVIMVGALFCLRHAPARALGIVLLAIAAVLKYFPLAAVILLLEARTRRELAGWLLLYGFVLLLAWPALAQGFHNAVLYQPAPEWLYAFGAPVVFRDFALPSASLLGATAAGVMLAAVAIFGRPNTAAPAKSVVHAAWATPSADFVCGAVMIVGCFLHGSSYLYKLVFALFLLRGLWQPAENRAEDRWRRMTWRLLLAVLWFEGVLAVTLNLGADAVMARPRSALLLKIGLVIGQVLTWALVACLWRYLVVYLDRQLRHWVTPLAWSRPSSHDQA